MAGPAASAASVLTNVLGALTPGQLFGLGHHLTQSDEARALQIITAMKMNPGMAGNMVPALSLIPNLPNEVMTWVSDALMNPATFQENMSQAEAACQRAVVQSGVLGNLIGGSGL